MTPLSEIIDNFAFLDEWEDRYRYVIDLGKDVPGIREEDRTAENKVQGCASQVWLKSHVAGSGPKAVMTFDGDSDAHIVRGPGRELERISGQCCRMTSAYLFHSGRKPSSPQCCILERWAGIGGL